MKLRRMFIIVLAIAILELSFIVALGWYVLKEKGNNVADEEFIEFQIYLQEKKLSENESIDFTFIAEQKINELEQKLNDSLFAGTAILQPDKSLIWWEELPDSISIREFEDTYDTSVPIIDMENDSIIVSFGRKIEFIRFFESDHYSRPNNVVASVTFSKEFFESTVFYYTVRRISNETTGVFVLSRLMSPCYIIQEEEKYLSSTLPFRYPK